jgi:membrane fusion protein (multidrug efflux system)
MDDLHPIENHDRAPWQSEAEKQQEKKPRDAIPSVTFRGHVDSFQPGTGSAFSVLPAENATGNYVKIVQRLPVKIAFNDDRLTNYLVEPGMSVVPYVRAK